MKNINDDYTMLLNNHLHKDIMVMSYPWVTFTDDQLLLDGPLNRPLEFAINEGRWVPHRRKNQLDDDFLFDVNFGLIIATRHKRFFMTVGQDFVFHKVVITSPFDHKPKQLFEGFWLIPTPFQPAEWIDLEKSKVQYRGEDNSKLITAYSSVFLKQDIMHTPENERLLFRVPTAPGTLFYPLVHKKLPDYIMAQNPKQVRCAPLDEIHNDPSLKYQ